MTQQGVLTKAELLEDLRSSQPDLPDRLGARAGAPSARGRHGEGAAGEAGEIDSA